jgi:hypothetical protein
MRRKLIHRFHGFSGFPEDFSHLSANPFNPCNLWINSPSALDGGISEYAIAGSDIYI